MRTFPGVVLLAALGLLAGCRAGGERPAAAGKLLWLVPAGGEPAGEIPAGAEAVAVVEIAADAAARERGLMFRDSMPADAGMLFVYPGEDERNFWMKNTRIPLSIAFADATGRIVRIAGMEPGAGRPESELELYGSGEPAKYALEMNRGWFSLHGIRAGDRIGLHPFLAAIEPR